MADGGYGAPELLSKTVEVNQVSLTRSLHFPRPMGYLSPGSVDVGRNPYRRHTMVHYLTNRERSDSLRRKTIGSEPWTS